MNKTVKELRETNAAMRDLLALERAITQLLLLDDELLKLEGEVGLMDGLPISAE